MTARVPLSSDEYEAKRKALDEDYLAEMNALYDDYRTKRKPLDADYDAKRNALYDDYRTKRKPPKEPKNAQ